MGQFKSKILSSLTLCLVLLGLTACSGAYGNRVETAEGIANSSSMAGSLLRTEPFHLYSYQAISPENKSGKAFTSAKQYRARIFIEGDGLTWLTKSQISPDPTPIDPMGLKMASRDCSVNRIYLARPCHYVGIEKQPLCTPLFWVSELYNDDVVRSYMQALDNLKERYKFEEFELVGYSGGAVIATRLAAMRDDVILLFTVAGNLDTEGFVEHHGVTPYDQHVNPTTIARQINIPQIHFTGANDDVIPGFLSKNFVRNLRDKDKARIIEVEGMEHNGNWPSVWSSRVSCPNT